MLGIPETHTYTRTDG